MKKQYPYLKDIKRFILKKRYIENDSWIRKKIEIIFFTITSSLPN